MIWSKIPVKDSMKLINVVSKTKKIKQTNRKYKQIIINNGEIQSQYKFRIQQHLNAKNNPLVHYLNDESTLYVLTELLNAFRVRSQGKKKDQ